MNMTGGSARPDADTVWLEAGSSAHTQDLVAAQNRARETQTSALKKWAPWAIGGAVLGGALWLIFRD